MCCKYIMKFIKSNLFLISAVILLAAGILAGSMIGRSSVKGGPEGISPLLVLFNPTGNYIDSVKLLNSQNPLERLSGYYAYSRSGLMDFNYLYNRYIQEDLTVIKNTIVWAASQSSSREEVVNFYKRIYKASDKRNRDLILNYIEKNDKEIYNDFHEKNR